MSWSKPTDTEKVQLRFRCPKCRAQSGDWCMQGPWRDVRAKTLHVARYNEAVKLRKLPLKTAQNDATAG